MFLACEYSRLPSHAACSAASKWQNQGRDRDLGIKPRSPLFQLATSSFQGDSETGDVGESSEWQPTVGERGDIYPPGNVKMHVKWKCKNLGPPTCYFLIWKPRLQNTIQQTLLIKKFPDERGEHTPSAPPIWYLICKSSWICHCIPKVRGTLCLMQETKGVWDEFDGIHWGEEF